MDECSLNVASQTLPPSTAWNDGDRDGDGVTNGQEVIDGTDPVDPCDFVLVYRRTFTTSFQAWLDADCDGDGVTNGDEAAPMVPTHWIIVIWVWTSCTGTTEPGVDRW
ncbi:MAG: thrombospondin type 3 repeat-containing protein [Flavobacteriaceae bacterium]